MNKAPRDLWPAAARGAVKSGDPILAALQGADEWLKKHGAHWGLCCYNPNARRPEARTTACDCGLFELQANIAEALAQRAEVIE